MPIHRNDPCPCASGKPHKLCCRNRPSAKPAIPGIARRVQEANAPGVPRRLRRAACRAIAKSIDGVTASQVFQPRGAAGCIYADASKSQAEHHREKSKLH
jgi:hypothetical protein